MEGDIVTFQISASPNTARPVSVYFSLSGTATNGADYTLEPIGDDPLYPRVVIPEGSDSGIVAMTVLVDHVTERAETATLTLQSGPYYSFSNTAGQKKKKKPKTKSTAPSATVTISDGP